MARMRSPNYPSIPLRQAIELIGKIHSLNRTNVIDRDSAVRDMGYSGVTGRSLKVLAALIQYGLLSKSGKGSVRVTQTAVDILHGIEPETRHAALLRAGSEPSLFKMIFERFPDGLPSENAIRSFLIQQGFVDVAIGPAIKSFMETYHDLEDIRESESHGEEPDEGTESPSEGGTARHVPPPPPPPPPAHGGYQMVEGERVVFSEETGAAQYLKLVAAGDMNDSLLEALEDYIKRQRKRLGSGGPTKEELLN